MPSKPTHRHPDGSLRIAEWRCDYPGDLPLKMANSDATALHLLSNGNLGSDIIRFPGGGGVPLHTHPGAHILFVLSGSGVLEAARPGSGRTDLYALFPGRCYLVDGELPHALEAHKDGMTLLVVGADHYPADSRERLELSDSNIPILESKIPDGSLK